MGKKRRKQQKQKQLEKNIKYNFKKEKNEKDLFDTTITMETYHGEAFHAAVHEGGESALGGHQVLRDCFVLARVPVLQALQGRAESIEVLLLLGHLFL